MNTRKQLTSLACLAIAVSAVAAGCESDSNEGGGEGGTAGENGYGGMKATGGSWGLAGNRPVGGTSAVAGNASTGGTSTVTWTTAGAAGMAVIVTGGSGPLGTGGTGTSTTGGTGTSTTGGTSAAAGGSTSAAGATAVAGSGGVSVGTSAAVAGNAGAAGSGAQRMSFFVTSDTNTTGDLGGLVGADARCQALASTVGEGTGVWHAYLSAEGNASNGNVPVNARDRIGTGPWYNANGRLLASNLTDLHWMDGDPELFVDERGSRINGQWAGSPTPIEHDVLTGSTPNGTVMVGYTCASWTSSSVNLQAQVGHSDGIGPSMNTDPPYDSWNSSHANESCADTAPRGGAGRLYCFRVN